jgi:hypothetical protein
MRIKILTEEGRDQANVIIPFEKGRTSIINIRARTIQPDGKIIEFDGKVYEQMVEKTKGVKYLAKTFTLPDVHAGSIIEYHYSIDFADHWIFGSHWLLSEDLFTKKAIFTLKPYQKIPWNCNGAGLQVCRWEQRRLRRVRSHCPDDQREHSGLHRRRLHAAGE